MGNFSIKAKILRCETCFMLKKLLIEPSCPDSTIVSECSCGFTRTTIKSFVDEIKKKEIYELKCDLCKKEVKQALYCIKCRRLSCNTCKIIHEEMQSNQDEHIYIDPYKYDFHCAYHHEKLFIAYCMDCDINVCFNCIKEKRHKKHMVVLYNKLEINEKEVAKIKNNIKLSDVKIIKNVNIGKAFFKQIKDEEKKELLKNVFNNSYKENKNILGLIQYFLMIYEDSKNKNYTIIFNLIENIKFNQQPFTVSKSASFDEKLNNFIEYLKNDFILFKRYVSTKVKNNNNQLKQKQKEKNNEIKINNKENNSNEEKNENEINDINEENLNNKENNNDKNININIENEGELIKEDNKIINNDNMDKINNNLLENDKAKRALTFDLNMNDIINDKDGDIIIQKNDSNNELDLKLDIDNFQKDDNNLIINKISENDNNNKINIKKNENSIDDINNNINIDLQNDENKIENISNEKNNIDEINDIILNEENKKDEGKKQKDFKRKSESFSVFDSKKEMFENNSKNKNELRQTLPIKKNSNILKNEKFSQLANVMKEKLAAGTLGRSFTTKNQNANIITQKENPNELLMNKPVATKNIKKKKPKKKKGFFDD